ncbi:hypothetical protein [Cohnella abietis]|uniref:Uncharacterized protein n=1 Tax=Cohnella abietis TaxID=2507935 RepID=A0A3T1D2Y4_9BACL|nr:hypothetical protein [Cohnella abietis]BBI32467.1 hypothetical protein KCTCHS21_18660 [Cohnella abietis]
MDSGTVTQVTKPKVQRAWNDYQRVNKTRKLHLCAMTGKVIPIGSSCWHYTGEFEGDFQSWYCTDEAKAFADTYDNGEGSWECQEIGEAMREKGLIS